MLRYNHAFWVQYVVLFYTIEIGLRSKFFFKGVGGCGRERWGYFEGGKGGDLVVWRTVKKAG